MEADKDQLITEDADAAYRKCPGVNNVAYVVSGAEEVHSIILTCTVNLGRDKILKGFFFTHIISSPFISLEFLIQRMPKEFFSFRVTTALCSP